MQENTYIALVKGLGYFAGGFSSEGNPMLVGKSELAEKMEYSELLEILTKIRSNPKYDGFQVNYFGSRKFDS